MHDNTKIKVKHLRRRRTIPNALSPKSLSFSLRHTAVGVFLLDSLEKKTRHRESKCHVSGRARSVPNTQSYLLVENNLHGHTRFHYCYFHPLAAQVNGHDSYSHCKHKDMHYIKLLRQTGDTMSYRTAALLITLIVVQTLRNISCVFHHVKLGAHLSAVWKMMDHITCMRR